jgi:hypothetical protein
MAAPIEYHMGRDTVGNRVTVQVRHGVRLVIIKARSASCSLVAPAFLQQGGMKTRARLRSRVDDGVIGDLNSAYTPDTVAMAGSNPAAPANQGNPSPRAVSRAGVTELTETRD